MSPIEVAYKIDSGEESLPQAEYVTLALDYIRAFDRLHTLEEEVAHYIRVIRFYEGRTDG